MQKGGRKKTAWMKHVSATMENMPNVALRYVLKAASKTYKKGIQVTAKAHVLKKGRRRRRRGTRRRTRRRTSRRRTRRRTRRRPRRRRRMR